MKGNSSTAEVGDEFVEEPLKVLRAYEEEGLFIYNSIVVG